ncbi:hypothetical protein [Cytobacillus praedii]|nr:hypothetical protein [Cytobacillus praedii]
MSEKSVGRSFIKRMKDENERKARGKVVHKADEGQKQVKRAR